MDKQEQIRRERGLLAKDFLRSDFFVKFLLPYVEKERIGSYPNPTDTDWENKYRYAYAKDEVFTALFTSFRNWEKEAEDILKKEKYGTKDIIEA